MDNNKIEIRECEQQQERNKNELSDLKNKNVNLSTEKNDKLEEFTYKLNESKTAIETLQENLIKSNDAHANSMQIKINEGNELCEKLTNFQQIIEQTENKLIASTEQLNQCLTSKKYDDENYVKIIIENDQQIDMLKCDINQLNENIESIDNELNVKKINLDNTIQELTKELASANVQYEKLQIQLDRNKQQQHTLKPINNDQNTTAIINQSLHTRKIMNFSQNERKLSQNNGKTDKILSLERIESYHSSSSEMNFKIDFNKIKLQQMKLDVWNIKIYFLFILKLIINSIYQVPKQLKVNFKTPTQLKRKPEPKLKALAPSSESDEDELDKKIKKYKQTFLF